MLAFPVRLKRRADVLNSKKQDCQQTAFQIPITFICIPHQVGPVTLFL
jgi:hypothetical protein